MQAHNFTFLTDTLKGKINFNVLFNLQYLKALNNINETFYYFTFFRNSHISSAQ